MGINDEININEEMSKVFQDETHDQLERMMTILLQLEDGSNGENDVVPELFRIAHNIKGSAGMMGLEDLKVLMHTMENLYDAVRNRKRVLDSKQVDFLLECSRQIMTYVQIGNWDDVNCFSHLREYFNDILSTDSTKCEQPSVLLVLSDEENQEVAAWQESGHQVYGVEGEIDTNCMMPGAAAILLIEFLKKYGCLMKTSPDMETMKNTSFSIIKAVLKTKSELTPEQANEIISYVGHGDIQVKLRKWVYRSEKQPIPILKNENHPEKGQDSTVRVDCAKVEQLVNEIQDLLVINASIRQLASNAQSNRAILKNLDNISQQLDILTESIQQNVMSLGMVPIKQLFGRFPLIVREVAKKKSKQVELVCFGEDTEIDKRMAEQLVNPLTHLVRNAIDHGLEGPERRKESGKPQIGTVTLRAEEEGDYIVISVSDDGLGLDAEKIRSKAVKQGLIKNDDPISHDRLLNLIFQPGFSTADTVSDISGRGVGLDVVRDSINDLKGEIEVNTVLGKGTVFRLKVPLTLAVIQTLLVKAGEQTFGIPLDDVVGSLLIKPEELERHGEQIFCKLPDGEEISVLNLNSVLNIPERNSRTHPMLIIKGQKQPLGLVTEEIAGQEKVVLKQINRALETNPIILGAAFLGGGEMAVMLNTQKIR